MDDADDGNGATNRRATPRTRERMNAKDGRVAVRTGARVVTDAMCDAIDDASAEEDEDAWKDLGLGGAR